MSNLQIETERLTLRQFTARDWDDFYRIRSDPEVMRFITGAPPTPEQIKAAFEKTLQRWEEQKFGRLAIRFHDSEELIGWCGLDLLDKSDEVEVGYAMLPKFWGQGIASEVAAACIRYGFESLKLERIVAVSFPENVASWKVMKKLGMRYVKNARFYDKDVVYYEINRTEFRPSASRYVLRDNP